ncbi:hypothetical protein L6164_018076 [Bauhinia variegata]|uniref:Uncharacterized protein n=1 Tax=Bauhinia variegata TaxID=167791 RepID=A0ACB9NBE4_BAUVA|nr:hypothetical protein L6164_018076 [Bauhinia variegata]
MGSGHVFLMMLLITVGGIEYRGSSQPFHQHPMIMLLFLTAACTHAMAFTLSQIDDRRSVIFKFLCHASGILANELLLLILVKPLHCIIINATLVLLALALYVFPQMGREVEANVENPDLEAAAHVEPTDEEGLVILCS